MNNISCPNCKSLDVKIDYTYPTMDTNSPIYTYECQICNELFQRN